MLRLGNPKIYCGLLVIRHLVVLSQYACRAICTLSSWVSIAGPQVRIQRAPKTQRQVYEWDPYPKPRLDGDGFAAKRDGRSLSCPATCFCKMLHTQKSSISRPTYCCPSIAHTMPESATWREHAYVPPCPSRIHSMGLCHRISYDPVQVLPEATAPAGRWAVRGRNSPQSPKRSRIASTVRYRPNELKGFNYTKGGVTAVHSWKLLKNSIISTKTVYILIQR